MMKIKYSPALLLLLTALLLACEPKSVPIDFGSDECIYCRMKIIDPKYGAETVNDKGKPFKYDDVNCMVTYAAEQAWQDDQVALWMVVDFGNPTALINAEEAIFIESEAITSPMLSKIAAFSEREKAMEMMHHWPDARELNWTEVQAKFSPK